MSKRAVLLAVTLLLAGGRLLAQVPSQERIPIRDPDRLRAMGFAPDATNVSIWSRAEQTGGAARDEKSAAAPETWGTAVGFTTLGGFELDVEWPQYIRLYRGNLEASCEDNSSYSDSVNPWAVAKLALPDGAVLGNLRFWGYDSDSDRDLHVQIVETCQPEGRNPPSHTVVAESQTFLAIGDYFGFTSLNGLTVDNRSCSYAVRVGFGPEGDDECNWSSLIAQKIQVTWTRQVSPTPSAATFVDVPTDHPFFQFVEALAKSGITGGCGAGNYCPDAPLTRGQMAVFLAKGLGLQWP